MARKTPIERLDAEIMDILNKYADDIGTGAKASTEAVAKVGARAVKANARSKFNGKKYAGGWTYTLSEGRLYSRATIHNATRYQLAHLLENGHALKRGGRTIGRGYVDGRPHIKPVEEEVNRLFEKEIKAII